MILYPSYQLNKDVVFPWLPVPVRTGRAIYRSPISIALFFASTAPPTIANLEKRNVTQLDPTAFAEAHKRDDTATRAFSSVPIITSSGQCLFVDELSGDFRANLTPVQVATCEGSPGQGWDVITSGEHDDQLGAMLVVSTLVC